MPSPSGSPDTRGIVSFSFFSLIPCTVRGDLTISVRLHGSRTAVSMADERRKTSQRIISFFPQLLSVIFVADKRVLSPIYERVGLRRSINASVYACMPTPLWTVQNGSPKHRPSRERSFARTETPRIDFAPYTYPRKTQLWAAAPKLCFDGIYRRTTRPRLRTIPPVITIPAESIECTRSANLNYFAPLLGFVRPWKNIDNTNNNMLSILVNTNILITNDMFMLL